MGRPVLKFFNKAAITSGVEQGKLGRRGLQRILKHRGRRGKVRFRVPFPRGGEGEKEMNLTTGIRDEGTATT